MTNAEKYLKDETDIKEFSRNMFNYLVNRDEPLKIKIENYLQENVKPTLTEDERVILKNIDKKFKSIKRANDSYLYLVMEDNAFRDIRYEFEVFPNLFQFIKERRRISNSRAFERRIKMLAEFLICAAIAFAITVGLGLLIKFVLWLDENTDIDVEASAMLTAVFITIIFGVWFVRACIRENKEAKLERRRI